MASFDVKTGIEEELLMKLFTKDISAEECIYDLIDNSIDAAREKIQSGNFETDDFGLPSDYSGFVIDLVVKEDNISIEDNCRGFSQNELKSSTFVIGVQSSSSFSIGHYGICLLYTSPSPRDKRQPRMPSSA